MYSDYIEIFIPYLLAFFTFCLWNYGIKKTIRNIFKNFLYVETKIFIAHAQSDKKKEILKMYYNSACEFMDKFTLKEALEVVGCIDRFRKAGMVKIPPQKIYDEDLERYSKIALKTLFGCLLACTFRGFLSFFFHMWWALIKERLQASNDEPVSIFEKFGEKIPHKIITDRHPGDVFQSFGEVAHATASCSRA